MKRLAYFVALIALLVVGFATVQAQGNRPDGVATHIIVFRNNARVNVPEFAQANGIEAKNVYSHALNGFSAVVPAGRLNALQRNPNVAYIVENAEVSLAAQAMPTGIKRVHADTTEYINGIDDIRVDVDVAVIDSGIAAHPDLNVVSAVDCRTLVGKGKDRRFTCYAGGTDDNGHGTHVAGTIAALDNGFGVVGVAPGARLHSVKVLDADGTGYTDAVIAGIDWAVAQGNIEVINLSVTASGVITAYGDAVNNAVNSGVVVVVAAGNNAQDAGGYSPAYAPAAITVSALADFNGLAGGGAPITCRGDVDDTLAFFSNFGASIDIAAPGVCILSTMPGGQYGTMNGTSMAAPHVAGAAALLASGSNSPSNAAEVYAIRNSIVNNGTFDWTDTSGDGIQEPLLNVAGLTLEAPSASTPQPTPTAQPTPAPTQEPCRGKNCK